VPVRRPSGRELFEALERRLRREIWRIAPLDAVIEVGVQMRCFGPMLATTFGGLPAASGLNVIHGADEPGAAAHRYLREAVSWMSEWEVDFLVSVAAGSEGAEEAELWLNWHGFEQGPVTRKYVRRATLPDVRVPPDVEVIELHENETEGLSTFVPEGYGLPDDSCFLFCGMPEIPGCRCYSAYLDGNEVACGSMLIADGVAVLAFDVTTEYARRRGCHHALLRRRLIDAIEAGCHTIVASAPDEPGKERSAGAASLLSAGFTEAYRSVSWRPPYEHREERAAVWVA
jgi:hypothetical protein